jgi:hypothetical protein
MAGGTQQAMDGQTLLDCIVGSCATATDMACASP